MKVTSLYVLNFRNYQMCEVRTPAMINVFYGQNAQGKTNLLEAIFYSSFGFSHRTSSEEDLLALSSQAMAVNLEYQNLYGAHAIKIKRFQQNERWKKEIILDGVKVKPKEHYGAFNTVMFSPEDLQLVKGEPALRRRFFDIQIAQTDLIYYDLLVKYNRVLLQRNRLLKEIRDNNADVASLAPWNEEFARLAAAIVARRLAALAKLNVVAQEIYASITSHQEDLLLQYEMKANNSTVIVAPSQDKCTEAAYRQMLLERQRLDILRGNTGVGPHRDDLQMLLNGLSLRSFGSQGQQRTGALALKLSQLEYVHRELGEYPVLLLDDVMSELDNARRAQLLLFIDGRVQTFITVNDKELIPNLANNAYFYIEKGTVREDTLQEE